MTHSTVTFSLGYCSAFLLGHLPQLVSTRLSRHYLGPSARHWTVERTPGIEASNIETELDRSRCKGQGMDETAAKCPPEALSYYHFHWFGHQAEQTHMNLEQEKVSPQIAQEIHWTAWRTDILWVLD